MLSSQNRDLAMVSLVCAIVLITILCWDCWCVFYTCTIFLSLLSVYQYVVEAKRPLEEERIDWGDIMFFVIMCLIVNAYYSNDRILSLFSLHVMLCIVIVEAVFCSRYSNLCI